MFENFFVGVLASTTSAVIVFLVATASSAKVRKALTAVASTFLGVEVKYVFNNGKEAEVEIKKAINNSCDIRIFTGRGNEFQSNYFSPLFDTEKRNNCNIKILLPDIFTPPRGLDWIVHREDELSTVDGAFGQDLLKTQIGTTYHFLKKFISSSFTIKSFDLLHIGRIILTDDFVFVTPYSQNRHGRDCRVHQYGRGDNYNMWSRFFDNIWQDSNKLTV